MGKIVVFGATGYTGELTVEALVKAGVKPVIAGRSENKLKALSERLGDLPYQLADIADKESVKALVEKGDVLLTTVGPFMRYGDTALEAAIEKGAHYVDSTGEPNFIAKVVDGYSEKAKQADITMITAAAYDYVPGNCVAALVLEKAGDAAVRVDVGYFGAGEGKLVLSGGTKESILHVMTEKGNFWRKGKLLKDYGGRLLRHFVILGKKRPAISVATSEPFFLPRSYPQLEEVNVYLGWFGIASYAMQIVANISAQTMKLPGSQAFVKKIQPWLFQSDGTGPGEEERNSGRDTQVVAIAYDCRGKELSSAELHGIHPYTYTAAILSWTARQLADDLVESRGVLGPVEAFGVERLVDGCRESGLELI